MKLASLVATAAAALLALTLFDASTMEAVAQGAFSGRPGVRVAPRVVPRAPRVQKSVPHISKAPRLKANPNITKAPRLKANPGITKAPRNLKAPSTITKAPLSKGGASALVKKGPPPTLNLRTLPRHKAAVSNQFVRGRVALPKNFKPKLSLAHTPRPAFRHRFSPFVQRHWKKAFFWVAVAGIGYVTVPHLYYDRFYTCVNVDDPIYDDCMDILSYAALEEEEVVRVSMPPAATYRYRARTAAPKQQTCPSCRWDRFVERKWNQSFTWVKVPEIGNVTVPDSHYDRFYTFAAASPPNYPQACQVLQEAASAREESGELARVSMPSGVDYRFEAGAAPTAQCTSCTFDPFVERKWNREFVWVQIPETGNVTVPEDHYDRFQTYASSEPPNYSAACKVLVEAAAADTVMTTALDNRRGLE